MIYFFRGNDAIWKKLLINGVVAKWDAPEEIWVPDVEEDWLIPYIYDRDNLVLRSCDGISKKFYDPIKHWRDAEKGIVFEAESFPSGQLRRRLLRLSAKKKDCKIGSQEARRTIEQLAKTMRASGELMDVALKIGSVTRAYWLFKLYNIGMDMDSYLKQEAHRQAKPWDVLWWRNGVLRLRVPELLLLLRGLARIAVQARSGVTKWGLVQEALRTDHSMVAGLVGGGKMLADRDDLLELFLKRAEIISQVLVRDPEAPMEYLYVAAA